MSLGKPVVKDCFMDEEMKDFAISEAMKALDNSNSEKLVASYMKSTFQKKYKSVWHCIVGRNFGSYVTHEVGRYIYFYIGQKGFLIWSTVTHNLNPQSQAERQAQCYSYQIRLKIQLNTKSKAFAF